MMLCKTCNIPIRSAKNDILYCSRACDPQDQTSATYLLRKTEELQAELNRAHTQLLSLGAVLVVDGIEHRAEWLGHDYARVLHCPCQKCQK